MSIDLNNLIDRFVSLHDGVKQREAEWYKLMGTTVGGSELSAVMGTNPYSSLFEVVCDKISILDGKGKPFVGSEACRWGSLFENVIGTFIEIDLGTKLKGTKICIQTLKGHRNSPDGYIVGRCYKENGKLVLYTTDMDRDDTIEMIFLVEFKCPLTRKPTGEIPPQYRPQVLSGLAVSTIAHRALYIDSTFRKCKLSDLGDNVAYDTEYHARDNGWLSQPPIAWGIAAVYLPIQTTNAYTNENYNISNDASIITDLGEAPKHTFAKMLELIDDGTAQVRHTLPCFADGRGSDLYVESDIDVAMESFRDMTPTGFRMCAVIPWKLFDVKYVPTERSVGYIELIQPLIENVHAIVSTARTHDDPIGYVRSVLSQSDNEYPNVSAEEVQNLFDFITANDKNKTHKPH